ncbi:MAG: rhomboid family intramembrane serine protease [Bdellovibrionia bacterium]
MPIRLTPVVKILLIACFAAFLVQQTGDQFLGTHLLQLFGLVPAGVLQQFRVWQLFTYSFIHADVMHLFFNLLMLAFIGAELEIAWGAVKFLRFYFFCSISAGLFYLFLEGGILKGAGMYTPMVGASGAIYGLLMAYGLIFGERILLFMMLFPMKAKHFVWILALIELMSTLFSSGGSFASIAHLGGMVAGFVFLWTKASWILHKRRKALLAPEKARAKKRRVGSSKHLKLIINNDREFESPDSDDQDPGKNPKTWH